MKRLESHIYKRTKNHKDKGHPSVVYAAPATLNGEVGNIAVSVLYGDARRVHSLRVLTPSGKEFILVDIKNTELQNGGSGTKSAVEPPISSVSGERISQKPNSVNRDSLKNSLREVELYERLNESDKEIAKKVINKATDK